MSILTDELRKAFPRARWQADEYIIAEEQAAPLKLNGEQIRAVVRNYRAESKYATPIMPDLVKRLRRAVQTKREVGAGVGRTSEEARSSQFDAQAVAWWKSLLVDRQRAVAWLAAHPSVAHLMRAKLHPGLIAEAAWLVEQRIVPRSSSASA